MRWMLIFINFPSRIHYTRKNPGKSAHWSTEEPPSHILTLDSQTTVRTGHKYPRIVHHLRYIDGIPSRYLEMTRSRRSFYRIFFLELLMIGRATNAARFCAKSRVLVWKSAVTELFLYVSFLYSYILLNNIDIDRCQVSLICRKHDTTQKREHWKTRF